MLSVHARGTFLCYKYAVRQMIQQGRGGRIVGASSVAGLKGLPHSGHYCAAKFAIRGLTQGVGEFKFCFLFIDPYAHVHPHSSGSRKAQYHGQRIRSRYVLFLGMRHDLTAQFQGIINTPMGL